MNASRVGRGLCAGGCHHEAFVRYGDTGHANLHYCDWIREWTDTCLKIHALACATPNSLKSSLNERACHEASAPHQPEGQGD
jgi:uncharacterized protein